VERRPVTEPLGPHTPISSPAVEELPESTGSFRKPRKVVEAEMDMTPMVDVTFLLLIFFMVTAAFAVQKATEIPKPEPPDETAQPRSFQVLEDDPSYVTVHIDEFGAFRVTTVDWDRPAFSRTELLRNLKDARGGSAGGQIPTHLLVRAHGDALHEKVVYALDAGNEVGMDDVQLLTFEEE
jgi:biopolymer transport protein ExbD